jgi:hypothetical protein
VRRAGTGRLAAAVAAAVAAAIVLPAITASVASASILPGYGQSVRWSGWVDQGRGIHFKSVSATWRVPGATCSQRGGATYSLTWIGLGGQDENKLEQIGTETDCTPRVRSAPATPYSLIWWEVLPAPEQYPVQQVDPGDLVQASVTVKGKIATLSLKDLTLGWKFVRRTKPRKLTEDSADWIEEDPEICPGTVIFVSCPEKPFAHYRTVTFTHAKTTDTAGFTGSISDPHWYAFRYGMIQGNVVQRLLSWPSPLRDGGTSFSVSRTNRPLPPEPQI